MQARRVDPHERFHVRAQRRRYLGPGPVRFRRGSRYYHCPSCGRRTLVRPRWLSTWEPAPSQLPRPVRELFDRVDVEGHNASFDFRCGGCERPVRLLYWEQETGMGGRWYPIVKAVVELVEEDDALR